MLNFLIDADMPRSAGKLLKQLGHNAIDVRDTELLGAKDSKVFEFAQREERIILTRNLGFANTLIYPIGSHAGICVMRVPAHFTSLQINNVIQKFIQTVREKQLINSLTIIEPYRYRIKKL